MYKIIPALCLIALNLTQSTWADATAHLQEKLNAIRTMRADFNQRVMVNDQLLTESSGTMMLLRPGRFRWQTKKPMAQLIIADGKKLWIYDKALEQVIVKQQQNNLGATPSLFLSRNNLGLEHDFTITEANPNALLIFDLHAKSAKENYAQIKLTFNMDNLITIEFYDQLGQHTIIDLAHSYVNLTLTNNLFQFTPPKGVDVVKQ